MGNISDRDTFYVLLIGKKWHYDTLSTYLFFGLEDKDGLEVFFFNKTDDKLTKKEPYLLYFKDEHTYLEFSNNKYIIRRISHNEKPSTMELEDETGQIVTFYSLP